MLVWEFGDMMDLSQDEHYVLQEMLAAQTCRDDYDQDFSDYMSIGTEE